MTHTSTAADPVRAIVSLTNAAAAARCLHVVAELGVADTISPDEEVGIDLLAERCGCNPDALHRVLRLLEVHGVFHSEQQCWSHTTTSVLLRSDHPTSTRAYARMIGQPGSWQPMTELAESVRTGRPAPMLHEVGGTFAYLARHPDQLAVFDAAMTAKAHADVGAILATVDFSRYPTIADIGGGSGHLIRAIVDRHPNVRGVLVDLPQVIERVEAHERVESLARDFFVDVLPPADLSILMQVIHDWDDTDAERILAAVAAATAPGATVMLFEWLLPEHPTDDAANVLDVFMLAVTGGRERTAIEYRDLLDRTGFDVTDIRQLGGPMFAIQAERKHP